MELALDITRNDLFSYVNLQRVAGNTTYVPQALGQMRLFDPEPIDTRNVQLYSEDNIIRLVPTTEPYTPDTRQVRDTGKLYALRTSALRQIDSVRAGELIGVANMALPETVRARNLGGLVTKRTTKMKTNLELTKEFHRLGALQGKLLDADGTTVIADYFDIFGITAPAAIDVDFTMAENLLMQFFQDTFLRPMSIALRDGGRATPGMYVGALVGDGFWAKLMTHPGFRDIYKLQLQAQAIARASNPLVVPNNWMEVDFAGIRWINYQGMSNGAIAIATDEARFFPVGASDVFKVYWAPGETLLDIDQPGKPEYLYLQPDTKSNMPSFLDIVLRSYPLYACIFPKALMRARVKPS